MSTIYQALPSTLRLHRGIREAPLFRSSLSVEKPTDKLLNAILCAVCHSTDGMEGGWDTGGLAGRVHLGVEGRHLEVSLELSLEGWINFQE